MHEWKLRINVILAFKTQGFHIPNPHFTLSLIMNSQDLSCSTNTGAAGWGGGENVSQFYTGGSLQAAYAHNPRSETAREADSKRHKTFAV